MLDTRPTLIRVCDFLGEEFEPEMLRFFDDPQPYLSDIDGDIHRKLERGPRAEDVGRWRREMPPEEQLEFERAAGDALQLMSYETRGAEHAAGRP